MKVRYATADDIRRLADIGMAANSADPLMLFLRPGWNKYPDDMHSNWCHSLREFLYQPGAALVVVEAERTDVERPGDIGLAVALAVWVRFGQTPPPAVLQKNSYLDAVNRRLESAVATLSAYIWRNRTDCPENIAVLRTAAREEAMKNLPHEHWHLMRLSTDPAWQGKGTGEMLVRWGLEQAQAEGMAAGVMTGKDSKGSRLYAKCGFQPVSYREVGPVTLQWMKWDCP